MSSAPSPAWDLGQPSYAITVRLPGAEFDRVQRRVREELQKEGFGVLTEIDLQGTLKKKLDVDVGRYLILGACNPPLAHRAVTAEPAIGALLPCNVMVVQEVDGVAVSAIDPVSMFSVVGRAGVEPIAEQVRAKLEAALQRVAA